MSRQHLTRRNLLRALGGSAAATALAACGGGAPTPAPAKPAEAPGAQSAAAKPPAEAPKPGPEGSPAPKPAGAVNPPGASVNPPGSGAAAPTAAPTVAPVQAAAGQTVVRYMDRADVRFQKFVEGWIKEFEAKNSKVKIQNEPIPSDWEQKVTAALAAGAAPDAIAVYGHWFRIYMEKSQIVELTNYVAKDFKQEDVNDFLPGQWKAMQLQGKQLAIPQYVNINTLYVNKDAAKEMNADVPGNDYTYEQMLTFITKMHKKAGDKVERFAFTTGLTDDGFIRTISLIWGQGGQINPADDITKFTFTKPETVKAFQWIHDIFWKLGIGAKNAADMGGLTSQGDAFWAGKIATMFQGASFIPLVPEGLKMNWDVLPPPKGPGGRGQRISVDGYMVAKTAKAPDLAWEVIKDLTSKPVQEARTKITLIIPSRKSAIQTWTSLWPDKNLKALLDTADEARSDPRSNWLNAAPTWNAIKPINEELFIVNKITVEEAMQKMQAAAEKAQKDG
jgi:ABC-type glycerol-3-phosphate transport system substrate-binding protein